MSPAAEPASVTHAEVVTAVACLDREAMAARRWFGGKGRTIERIAPDAAFVLDADARHVLVIATLSLDDRTTQRYALVLTGPSLREAVPGDGAWRSLAVAMAQGRTLAALQDDPTAPIAAVLVCRPAAAMPPTGPGAERDLGADQSNTSVVLGDEVLLKAYRRLQPGLNPDLEMTAFLTEEAGFGAVPPLAGFAELVEARHGTTTVAMAQQFVAEGSDAYETIAETLTGWLMAPGSVSLEYATEVAADLGLLTAGLHAAVADGRGIPDMAPRPATRDEIRRWAAAAHEHLERAMDVAALRGRDPSATLDDVVAGDDRVSLAVAAETIRDLAPRILDAITVLDAVPTAPEVIRAHGDLHLGQILITPDGYRIIDFEGEPLSTPDERRVHRHPLRDVASMLRSLDHVGRSAGRRAARRGGGAGDRSGLDLSGWLERSRERFLESYRAGMLEARVLPDLDPALLLAFETDKELYEFSYAATYLPSWLWAPTEGMRGLFRGNRS